MSKAKKAAPKMPQDAVTKSNEAAQPQPKKAVAPKKAAPVKKHTAADHKTKAGKILHGLAGLLEAVLPHMRNRDGDKQQFKDAVKDAILKEVDTNPALTDLRGPELHRFINEHLDETKK